MKLSLASRPTASAAPMTAPRSGVSPWRNARASAQKRAAEAAKKRLSGVMPLPVNPNRGWNATASAPTVHAQGSLGTSSRRKRYTNSTVAAQSRADISRISQTRSSRPRHGEARYPIVS